MRDNDNEGWTEVRYGRRRNRDRQQVRGWGNATGRWMDRANTVTFRRQYQSPSPNRPAPPRGFGRYSGPQAPSYAAVVQGFKSRSGPRPGPRGQGREDIRQQPADPQFGRLVRKMHAVIKAVHHLQNVAPKEGKTEPRMISGMVEILASMIKPAFPTADTVDFVRGNATNWGYNTLMILEDHYTKALGVMLEELGSIWVSDWKPAFEVATRWARRNLPRITRDVIDHAEALIAARHEGNTDSNRDPVPQARASEQQQVPQPAVDSHIQVQPVPDTHTEQGQASQHAKCYRTVATMTESAQQGDEPHSPPVRSSSPLEQRKKRCRGGNNQVAREDAALLDFEGCSQGPPEGGEQGQVEPRASETLLDMGMGERWDASPILGPVRRLDASGGRAGVSEEGCNVDEEFFQWGGSQEGDRCQDTGTPEAELCRPTRHMTTDRKMIDWGLTVVKKWLIMGDSNLSRMPPYTIPDLQIESYPGANFRHAQALMAKSSNLVVVEKLVLSFGINCRAQRAKETSVKQMQAAVREAKKRFPYSEIWIPLINFSSALPSTEKETLQILNDHIHRNMPFIPLLRSEDFKTEKDHVHWTRETGKAMLAHWARCLN